MKLSPQEKIDEINKLLDLRRDWSGLQTFSMMQKVFKVGAVFTTESGAVNLCIYKDSHCIVWRTVIPPGAGFPKGWHNCREKCVIVLGELADELNDIYKTKGDVVDYEAFKKHAPRNPSEEKENSLIVIFYDEVKS